MKFTKTLIFWGALSTATLLLLGALPQNSNSSWIAFMDNGPLNRFQVARVWESRLKGSYKSKAMALSDHLLGLCETHGFQPEFILSVVDAESRFKPHAISPQGAIGLMQLMPETAAQMAESLGLAFFHPDQLKNPFINLTLGVTYLALLRDRFDGNRERMLAAYNAGPNRVERLESLSKKYPRETLKYIEAIRQSLPQWRKVARYVSQAGV